MTELVWRKLDAYCIRSRCGRFSIARVNRAPVSWYIAYRLPFGESQPSTELGATSVPFDASDDDRVRAINDLKQVCEAAV